MKKKSTFVLSNFPCTKCGCCCKRIGAVIKAGIDFPFKADKEGVCEMLKDNLCVMYDNRPTVCNIDSLVEILGVDKQKFYKDNIKACHKMMRLDGVFDEYEIKL